VVYNGRVADLQALTGWIEGYIRAWNSNDPADIGALFAEDARYYPEPFRRPWHGRDQIIRKWLARRDEPGQTTFDWHIIANTDDVAVIQGTTHYPTRTYSNLWLIRLDTGGQCREFTEWWMRQPARPPTAR
jgi:hypothetical protein